MAVDRAAHAAIGDARVLGRRRAERLTDATRAAAGADPEAALLLLEWTQGPMGFTGHMAPPRYRMRDPPR
eukprot:1019062-Pyramimonas_sp.AAC.1